MVIVIICVQGGHSVSLYAVVYAYLTFVMNDDDDEIANNSTVGFVYGNYVAPITIR